MAFLKLLASLGAICLAGIPFWWVLIPLDRAAKMRRCPTQFNLADIFCLFVLVQLLLGAIYWETPTAEVVGSDSVVVAILLCAMTLAWWIVVHRLSRAGVRIVWQRCVVLVVALPAAIGGGIALIGVPFAILDLFGDQHNRLTDACILLASVLLTGVVYGIGRFTRAIVATAVKE